MKTSPRTRVFLLNNYEIGSAAKRIEAGEYPSQHLWGSWELRDEFEWVIPPRNWIGRRGLIGKLLKSILPIVGDGAQEMYVLLHARSRDVIYSADQQTSALLGVARRFRLLRVPLLVMVHNGPRTRWTRFWMNGADRIFCISPGVQSRAGRLLSRPLTVLPWGPGIDSPIYRLNRPNGDPIHDFVAAGKTNRDYESLLQAVELGRLSGRVFDETGESQFVNGKLTRRGPRGDYRAIIAAMEMAKCVVIPLADPDRMSGLTEAADAIALNKPLIVTKSEYFPYKGEGVFTVESNEPEALLDALYAAASAAGAGKLSEEFSMTAFAQALRKAIQSTV